VLGNRISGSERRKGIRDERDVASTLDLVKSFYDSVGNKFESVFEAILTVLDIPYEKLDVKNKTGALTT
jgi:hypothetical protein